MAFWLLDVGCGSNPSPNALHVDISRQAAHLECICDAHHLPFIDKVFALSRLSRVLAHLDNPLLAIQEVKRVTRKTVIVVTTDAKRLGIVEESAHIFSWTANTLEKLLRKQFPRVCITGAHARGEARSKLGTARLFALSVLSRHSELVAVCEVKP